jgi:dihydrolipoamide dehydrogenase
MKSDLIIIGSGPGGYATAAQAAAKGLSVTIFEAEEFGGTCLNKGCIPTKSFCKNAEVLDNLKEAESYGIEDVSFTFDINKVVERKDEIISQLQCAIISLLDNPLINMVNEEATFKDSKTLVAKGIKYSADNIIIATGSEPKFLPIEGAHLPNVLTSDEILDIDHVPASLCVIGGGVIGMEFASIFNSFGTEVTVVEFCKEILPNFDNDITKRLKLSLSKKGIKFITGAAVTSIKESKKEVIVMYDKKGEQQEIVCEKALMAVGRKPHLPAKIEASGVEYNPHGIVVDSTMQTTVPGIYAIGDVNGLCMLAHAATFQGKRALNSILARRNNETPTDKIRLDIIPSAVFTRPEAAMVGLTEEEAKAKGIDFTSKKSFFRANGKALAMNEPEGIVKILVSNTDRKLLGCHLFGAHAADLVQEIADLIYTGTTIDDFAQMIHAHPTLGEVVQATVQQF